MKDKIKCTAATQAIHSGLNQNAQGYHAIVSPLYLTSNFAFRHKTYPDNYDYSRHSNPTRATLADALANLEGGAGGAITCSGMAAIHLTLCAFLKPNDRILAAHDCYGGTHKMFKALADKGLYDVDFVDMTNHAAVTTACVQPVHLLWIETPSNPLLRISDIAWLSEQAHKNNALLAVDNTFLSPLLQTPFALGADLVMHSTTKYINGHSDVIGGALIAKDPAHAEQIKWWDICLGTNGAPFDSFLTLRGLRTLDARLRVHQAHAQEIVAFAQTQPWVKQVFYPGLPTHAGYSLASQQQKGFGGMLSLELCPKTIDCQQFLNSLELITLAQSLGGVESLICHPATMTHGAMSTESRAQAGISESLIRLSIGLESPHDLITDLSQAAQKATRVS